MNIDLQIYLCPDCFVPVYILNMGSRVRIGCPKCEKEFMSENDLIEVTQDTVGK
jgi:uncharacterized paraquat-inducible protein A